MAIKSAYDRAFTLKGWFGTAQELESWFCHEWVATSQSGNVTLAVTGVSATAAIGSFLVGCALAVSGAACTPAVGTVTPSVGVSAVLTGVSSTGSAGSIIPSTTRVLTGSSSTGTVGTVIPTKTVALTGVPSTLTTGTITPALSLALTGHASTGSAGALVPSATVPLTGASTTGSAGTVTPVVGVTAALTGISSTASSGTLTPATTAALTGSSSTGAAGTVIPVVGVTVPLTGASATGSAGTLGLSHTHALAGSSGTGSAGTVVPSVGVSAALSGASSAGSAGTLTAATTVALAGISSVSDVGTMGATGGDGLGPVVGGHAFDSSGNAYHGTYRGGATLGQGALAYDPNTAVVLDGVDGCVVIPDTAALEMAGAMTWEAWVNPTALNHANGGNLPRIVCKNLTLLWVRSDGRVQFEGGIGYSTPQNQISTATVPLKSWTYLVVTWDNVTVSFYKNGALVDAFAMTGIPPGTTDPLIIGEHRLNPGMKRFWNGMIDEVAVYNTILTPTQIAAHWDASALGTYQAAVLADTPTGYWRFGRVIDNRLDVIARLSPVLTRAVTLSPQYAAQLRAMTTIRRTQSI